MHADLFSLHYILLHSCCIRRPVGLNRLRSDCSASDVAGRLNFTRSQHLPATFLPVVIMKGLINTSGLAD